MLMITDAAAGNVSRCLWPQAVTLKKVVIVDDEEKAKMFLDIKRAVAELVRLSKRLQEDQACIDAVAAVDTLNSLCCSNENRTLMAQLSVAFTMAQVFLLAVPTSSFAILKHHLFRLASRFVDDCPPNQEALSASVQDVFVPLLFQPEYMEE